MNDKPVLYLGGAMREANPKDVNWRRRAWSVLGESWTLLDPTSGKREVPHRKGSTFPEFIPGYEFAGMEVEGVQVVNQDVYSIKRSDAGLWNLTAFSEDYPCIGSLIEIGVARAAGKLIYVIAHDAFLYNHPFIATFAAKRFISEDDAFEYLLIYMNVLAGRRRI